jgi:hypothetical protein
MAGMGDSITRGFNACGWYVDCTHRHPNTSGQAKLAQLSYTNTFNG